MKTIKGVYIDTNFDYLVNYLGTQILCEQLEMAGIIKAGIIKVDKEYNVPKKFNKYIDDISVARIILYNSRKQFGKLYLSTNDFHKVHEEISFHVCDRIISDEYKKRNKNKPISISKFLKINKDKKWK